MSLLPRPDDSEVDARFPRPRQIACIVGFSGQHTSDSGGGEKTMSVSLQATVPYAQGNQVKEKNGRGTVHRFNKSVVVGRIEVRICRIEECEKVNRYGHCWAFFSFDLVPSFLYSSMRA